MKRLGTCEARVLEELRITGESMLTEPENRWRSDVGLRVALAHESWC